MERKVYTYPSLVSTNSEVSRLIPALYNSQSIVVVADYQEHGRGQAENRWVSDSGKNLLMSWLVYPAFLSVHLQFQLSKVVSLAISDLLLEYSLPSKVKWPNDIVCRNMKLGGVLIENSILGNKLKHSIIGIGLNVNQINFPQFSYEATSLRFLLGREIILSELRDALIVKLESRYEQLKKGDIEAIDKQYLERLFKINEKSFFTAAGRKFHGVIKGISELGELLVESDEGIAAYGFHEIQFHY